MIDLELWCLKQLTYFNYWLIAFVGRRLDRLQGKVRDTC